MTASNSGGESDARTLQRAFRVFETNSQVRRKSTIRRRRRLPGRVELLVAGYQKPLLGILAALEIGLDAMRGECPHFAMWLSRLEALAAA